MPLVPRHAGPAGPTERWPSARKVLTRLLCLCLGWLWTTIPVVAQDQIPPPVVEMIGPYRNLAENHNGTFHLRREGNAVYATFRTDRSPVQFLARDQPEVLLTVPEGFRPAVDVTWEVSARPVRTDGTPRPDQPARRVFRMRVDTAGQVRYVDDPGVDGVGYLRYDTALAWPLAGTEPRLCDRTWNIRDSILAAVQALEDISVDCTQVDWSHLARVRTLSLDVHSGNFARHDLLGLTNLAVLQAFGWPTYPNDLLAHTPRLQTLQMGGNALEDLPANLFRYIPRLAHLSLGSHSRSDKDPPSDLLVHTPHLESLLLEGRHRAELALQLLAHTPRLTRLTVTSSTPLPETLLATVPRLTHLTIDDGLEPCATPELLVPVPHLRHVAVRMAAEDGELACLGRALHLHTPTLAELHLELRDLQALEARVLPPLPRLTRLAVDAAGPTHLPAQLLAETPELTHLTLRDGTRDAALMLPEGFFAHTPRLISLSLQADRLSHMPLDLLTPLPELQQVQLVTEDATALPAWFLEQVTELRMDMGRSALPWDFLMHAPRLEVLHLTAHSLRSLPEGFLAHAPSLEFFRLDAGDVARFSNLSSFPEGFLTHAPSLVELRLRVPALQTFPPSFLGHVPRLETLELETTKHHPSIYREILPVMSLPANFLIHAPRLRHLDLEPLGHVKAFPPGFLSGSPQLRYLNLDANEATALPADFLSQHPHLETVRLRANHIPALPRGFLSQSPRLTDLKLDLQRVEALPEGFLADTPRLWNLGLDVHGVEALPPGFLADAPHLTRLNLRARNLTAWPADFLADAPRLRSLGLAMPLLEPTLTPDHRLWETLQATSLRVKVTRSTVLDPDPCQWHVKPGAILEVEGRTRDDRGRRLLRVSPWQERELFSPWRYMPYFEHEHRCLFLLDARFAVPTLEVCAADRDPKECIPKEERLEAPDPEWGREPEWGRG